MKIITLCKDALVDVEYLRNMLCLKIEQHVAVSGVLRAINAPSTTVLRENRRVTLGSPWMTVYKTV